MPTYDVVLLLKKMDKANLKVVLTRSAKYILETGGTLRRMDNLGLQNTPFRVCKKGHPPVTSAHYFIFNYDAGKTENREILDKFKRDLDVARSTSIVVSEGTGHPIAEKPPPECNLWVDLLPPPSRPNVVELLEKAKARKIKRDEKKFKFNTGLDHDPL